jgi:hypothetical protein
LGKAENLGADLITSKNEEDSFILILKKMDYSFEGHSSIWGMNSFRQNFKINAFCRGEN